MIEDEFKERSILELVRDAGRGEVDAQIELGAKYALGEGITKNHKEAARIIKSAVETDHPFAQYYLSLLYSMGAGVNQSDEKSAHWCTKAAEQGHELAQVDLGLMYAAGTGVSQSKDEAIYWYKQAVQQGNAEAVDLLMNLRIDERMQTNEPAPKSNILRFVIYFLLGMFLLKMLL